MLKKWIKLSIILFLLTFKPKGVIAGQVELLEHYPSDPTAFTQGLELTDTGQLLFATGQKGHSYWGILNLASGLVEDQVALSDSDFGEGISQRKDELWQLTYQSGKVFKWQRDTQKLIDTYSYEGEGWGLAYDQDLDIFWMTNGSDYLQKRSSQDFSLLKQIPITYQEKPVKWVNELEWVEGKLYGNIWQTNLIVCLDPQTGLIEDQYDLSPILESLNLNQETYPKLDVLNGIAHIEGQRFYLTGKYYPYILEVVLYPTE